MDGVPVTLRGHRCITATKRPLGRRTLIGRVGLPHRGRPPPASASCSLLWLLSWPAACLFASQTRRHRCSFTSRVSLTHSLTKQLPSVLLAGGPSGGLEGGNRREDISFPFLFFFLPSFSLPSPSSLSFFFYFF